MMNYKDLIKKVEEGDFAEVFKYLRSLREFLSTADKNKLRTLLDIGITGWDHTFPTRLKIFIETIEPILNQQQNVQSSQNDEDKTENRLEQNTPHIHQEENKRQKKYNQEAIDCDPKSLNLLDLGHCYLTNAEYKSAIRVLNKCIEQDANEALAWGYLADAYIAEKQEKEAQEALKKYLSIKPNDKAYQQKLDAVMLTNLLDVFAEQMDK